MNDKKIKKISKQIDTQKQKIKNLFLETQKLIFTNYFDNSINLAFSSKALENYRNKLYLFKNYVGFSEGDTSYNDYYVDKMEELEKRYEYNPLIENALTVTKRGLISTLIQKLKLLFGLNKGYELDR